MTFQDMVQILFIEKQRNIDKIDNAQNKNIIIEKKAEEKRKIILKM